MADMTMDVERAEQWVEKVEAEFEEVNKTLSEVKDLCSKSINETDTIMGAIYDFGEDLQVTWGKLEKSYRAVMSETKSLIGVVKKKIGNVVDYVADKIKN